MEVFIAYAFRFVMYVCFGFTLEIIFSVLGIERTLGFKLERRVPRKYLEGFVSLYMIPIHGLGMLFGFEQLQPLVADWHFILRYLLWAVLISLMEAFTGWLYDLATGFYCWDYYKDSRFKVFKRGYTLWTLVPQWGIAGMVMDVYSKLLVHLSPAVVEFFQR